MNASRRTKYIIASIKAVELVCSVRAKVREELSNTEQGVKHGKTVKR